MIENRNDGYWITGFECGDVGPYTTKAEALDDQRGLKRFYEVEYAKKTSKNA